MRWVVYGLCSHALLAALATAQEPADASQAQPDVSLHMPLGLALDSQGVIYVSERSGHRISSFDPQTGAVAIVAGTGVAGCSPDGTAAAKAQLRSPDSLAVDAAGNVLFADRGNGLIRRIDAKTGELTTVAGSRESRNVEDGIALECALSGPYSVALTSSDDVLFTDTDRHQVRLVDLKQGELRTLAGTGERGFSGDGGLATEACLSRPHVAIEMRSGDVIIGDSFNGRIRRIDAATGVVTTIAGNGVVGCAPDGCPALAAPFGFFGGFVEAENGDLLFTEWVNGRVLRLEMATQTIRVVAGTEDEAASTRDGQPPLATRFGALAGIGIDRRGRLLVVAADAGLVRRIDLEAETVETILGR
ncbi:MAG: hypothetical protein AAF628_14080 [Planctomycetota bacterium]